MSLKRRYFLNFSRLHGFLKSGTCSLVIIIWWFNYYSSGIVDNGLTTTIFPFIFNVSVSI